VDDPDNSLAGHRRSLEPGTARTVAGLVPSGETMMEIARALTQIRDLQDEVGRSTLVHAIGETLGTPLLPRGGHSSPMVFLYNLVVTCRDIPGGMPALVQSVEFLAGNTSAATRIRRLASPAHSLLETSVEMQVRDLLEGLSVPYLARLYHVAAGGGIVPGPHRLIDAWDAFSILLDANAGPDGPPHLVFVELLIQMLARASASGEPQAQAGWRSARLREWLTGQLEVLRATGEARSAARLERIREQPDLAIRADLPIYLIIQLEPVPDLQEGRQLCRLSHWRQLHPFQWRPEPGEDRVVPLDAVPRHIAELIQDAEAGWAYQLDDSLVLEFVLPVELLGLAPDLWTRDPPDERYPTPLGAEYEVIVRSHDRLRTRTLHRAWRQRWRVLADAIECATHWAAMDGPPDPELLRDQLLTRKDVVTCVLSSPPDREPGRTELGLALRTGIPVVLWHRGDSTLVEFREAMREVIERPDIRGLPADLKRLRGTAALSENRAAWVSRQVTLLWDNPHHFLDELAPLRPPQTAARPSSHVPRS
jgi:vWA-MoxR associated protein C-terminal domain/vWA-MoxR associated protein middle region 0/Effector-associated domain 2